MNLKLYNYRNDKNFFITTLLIMCVKNKTIQENVPLWRQKQMRYFYALHLHAPLVVFATRNYLICSGKYFGGIKKAAFG